MRIAQEEIFGPVVSVIRVKGFDAAIEAANSVRYGLAASVFTSDASDIFRFTDRIEAGIVHINSGTPGGDYMALTMPGEALAPFASYLRSLSPAGADKTLLIGYANDHVG